MSRRSLVPAEPAPPRELSVEQEQVIGELLTGATDAEVAERCGVGTRSIARWRADDALFVAMLNARRAELWEAQRERLRGMVRDALGVLADDLHAEDEEVRRAAARAVLRLFLRDVTLTPSGPTDERAVRQAWASEQLGYSIFGV